MINTRYKNRARSMIQYLYNNSQVFSRYLYYELSMIGEKIALI